MATVARITIYPIKSLDGLDVHEAALCPRGGIRMDRAFALVDEEGRYFNGKRDARVAQVRATFSPDCSSVSLSMPGCDSLSGPLEAGPLLAEWFSDAFGLTLGIVENRNGGFPDDEQNPGPTVTSWATLRAVGMWLSGPDYHLKDEELHRRFRTNIVLDDCPAFFEDTLFGDPGGTPFLIGDVRLLGMRASARCVVPSRDSRTGSVLSGFQKTFVERRRAELPDNVDGSRFDHFYRLCLNTSVPNVHEGQLVRVGDSVRAEMAFDFEW